MERSLQTTGCLHQNKEKKKERKDKDSKTTLHPSENLIKMNFRSKYQTQNYKNPKRREK
jgi:hypothetical protein